ncbi:DUF6946 family protein [Ilyobacter polytropus]|uniref:DUF6946 domain-containing protein n=1 Tax=Ilyobacter polytropus (strain ATCC 51220 / DSM 2926 / LMG 16218 / CuHBu1) TaxID=572544 RepID=E3H996_ILYPC|nr:hypothetical protein [Ilyobacter polytropus]ADO82795.1 hypothetical protein Ilyop_1014 [Ilyobacter polytropus DSM 2926]
MIIKNKNTGNIINNVTDWKNECPPKNVMKQWKKGYSAYELASEYVINRSLSIQQLFLLNGRGSNLNIEFAYPEYQTKIDEYGQGRVHDLLLLATHDSEDILISVEGKVNESFGNYDLSNYYLKSKIDMLNGQDSNKCLRIEGILKKLFGTEIPKNISGVKYQLLTGLIGTLEESINRNIKKAYFIIQVFNTNFSDKNKIAANHKEMNKLIKILKDKGKNLGLCILQDYQNLDENQIVGPYILQDYQDMELYIGYLKTP